MNYQKHTFPNGLRLITVPMPSVSSVTVMILVGVGSRYEEERVNGVTHFLEHMLFKGTKTRPKTQILAEAIDSIGAEWNASTDKEVTAYYIKAGASNFPRAFDILCDMVKDPLLSSREIEREKGVITAEIAMLEDTPMRRVADIFETLLYPNSSLGWDIAGTPQTISKIIKDDFLALRKKFYQAPNMVVVAAGNVKEDDMEKLTRKYLGKLKAPARGGKAQKEEFIQKEPQILVREKKTDQAHLVLGVRGSPRGSPERWVEEVFSAILGGGISSRLWLAVRERRGLAYYVRTSVEHYQDNGYLAVSAGVHPPKIDQAIRVIISELAAFRRGKGLSAKEVEKGKEFVRGHLDLSLEDTHNAAGFFGSFELLEDKIITPDDVKKRIGKVTTDDVLRVAEKFLVPERLNLAIIGPYQDSERFKKLLRL